MITDGERTRKLREALDDLRYVPIANHFHFARSITYQGQLRQVKIDFLAAPPPSEYLERMKIKEMRVRPRSFNGLHAYLTPEAMTVEERLVEVDLAAEDGETAQHVYLPHAFSFLVLKLFALRDRIDDRESQGTYHALDMFRIWALMTEVEWNEFPELRRRFDDVGPAAEMRAAVMDLFADGRSHGSAAIRDQALRSGGRVEQREVDEFVVDLRLLLLGESGP